MVKCTKGQIRRLKTALRWKGHPEQRQRIQMVLLRESGMTQPVIAETMGVSLSTVNRAHMAYDHGGLKALRRKPSGGRKRENMTLAEEKALLTRFAKAAGAGELLNIHDLKVRVNVGLILMRLSDLIKPLNQALFALVEETDVIGQVGTLWLKFLFNACNDRSGKLSGLFCQVRH